MDILTRMNKLTMVRMEIITLLPRLSEPYRSNLEACKKLLDEVLDDDRQTHEEDKV